MNSRTTIHDRLTLAGLLVTVGIVFGDIGTSPLYVMKAILAVNPHFDTDYVLGAVSCIIWTLTLQTTVKYVLLALHADNKGEGGILALFALLRKLPRKWALCRCRDRCGGSCGRRYDNSRCDCDIGHRGNPDGGPLGTCDSRGHFRHHSYFSSAAHGYGQDRTLFRTLYASVVPVARYSRSDGHIGISGRIQGIQSLLCRPTDVLVAGMVSDPRGCIPVHHGAEALYSDLGHCGRRNITVSWLFVKIMLILNYLGQGAWLIANEGHPMHGVNPFFSIIPHGFAGVGVIMATLAAVIASQALLSGSFTIFSEAVNLDFWPKLRIKYPSGVKGQLYIPVINWGLFAGCLVTVLLFRDSSHMEAAYGLAITVAMLMTTVLLSLWMRSRGVALPLCIAFFSFFIALEGLFFAANMFKFSHGGWYTLLAAGIVAGIMIVWHKSHAVHVGFIDFRPVAESAPLICEMKQDESIPKYASNLVYLSNSSRPDMVESKIIYSIIHKNPKRADHYWFIHIDYVDEPDTLEYSVDIIEPQTIYAVTMRLGFRVEARVSLYLRHIVEDLVASGRLDLRSGYESLRKEGIAGDFRFIILHRIFSNTSNCRGSEAFLMRMHDRLRSLGISDRDAYGLDTSLVTLETVPLIINTTAPRRIVPVS